MATTRNALVQKIRESSLEHIERQEAVIAALTEQLEQAHALLEKQELAIDRLHARIVGQTIQ